MKKIFILLLIVLSFSLTSCRRVKFESFENEATQIEFLRKYKSQYEIFLNMLQERDFEYKCIYKENVISESEPYSSTVLKSTFKQDLDNNLFEFTEKGIENNVRTNYENVKVDTEVMHFFNEGNSYIKDTDGKISEYHISSQDLFKNRCRVSSVQSLLRFEDDYYKFYVDENKYTKVINGERVVFGVTTLATSQVIFNKNVVTACFSEVRNGENYSYLIDIKMVFIFEDIELEL